VVKRSSLDVSIALSDNVFTRPLIEGRVQSQGLRLIPTVVHPSEMFWRQLHYGDFDISEMSLSSLFIAAAKGDRRWVAVPVYTMRRFFHTSILVRCGSGISTPQELKGRRVGVPEYQQTSAIWSRGILEDDFGVDARGIEWFMERGPERSHGGATGFQPPPDIRLHQIPHETNIGQMLVNGELDATLLYLADRNLVDRSRRNLDGVAEPLFKDVAAEGRRWHRATGLFPINHTLVVRRRLVEQHPWIALNLYSAFQDAKAMSRDVALAIVQPAVDVGLLAPDVLEGLDEDAMPYGFAKARRELEKIAEYVHRQGLTDRRITLEEVFAESVMAL
jgi:4,5-dihydroxyphthalate decarboxylase